MEANGLYRLNTIIKLCSHFGSYNYITSVFRIDSGSERVFRSTRWLGPLKFDSVGMSNGMSFWIGGQQDAPSDLYIIY